MLGGGAPTFNTLPLAFGTMMAGIDVFMLSLVKYINIHPKFMKFMLVPTLMYALQPWIFLQSLKFESLVVMNLMWDVISDVLVTFTGVFFFKEKIGMYKIFGVMLSFVSIALLSMDDGGWEFGFD